MPADATPPQQPKTTELPAVPAWAIELTHSVKSGIAELRADVALVSNDLGVVKDRVAILESFRNDQEQRATRASAGVRSLSTTDADHEAQLAQERAAREELATKVDALTTKTDALAKGHEDVIRETVAQTQILVNTAAAVSKFVATPTVKIIGGVLFGIVSTWLARHYGIELPK
jgi:hypothetical protein